MGWLLNFGFVDEFGAIRYSITLLYLGIGTNGVYIKFGTTQESFILNLPKLESTLACRKRILLKKNHHLLLMKIFTMMYYMYTCVLPNETK